MRIGIVLNDPQIKTPFKINAQIWHVLYCKTKSFQQAYMFRSSE